MHLLSFRPICQFDSVSCDYPYVDSVDLWFCQATICKNQSAWSLGQAAPRSSSPPLPWSVAASSSAGGKMERLCKRTSTCQQLLKIIGKGLQQDGEGSLFSSSV